MNSWLDRAAKRSARKAEAVPEHLARASDMSRREAMKRAAIVGGAVIAVPVMDSFLAPAFATSSGKHPGTCTGASDPNYLCGGSGGCPRCKKGQICYQDTDCVSKDCVHSGAGAKGTCAPAKDGSPCYDSNDCQGGSVCSSINASGIGTCTKSNGKNKKPKGSTCTTNQDCDSEQCVSGVCR